MIDQSGVWRASSASSASVTVGSPAWHGTHSKLRNAFIVLSPLPYLQERSRLRGHRTSKRIYTLPARRPCDILCRSRHVRRERSLRVLGAGEESISYAQVRVPHAKLGWFS